MSERIACRTMEGETVLIPEDKISVRPSAYGLIISDGKILLTKQRTTGKWWLPGGAMEPGEDATDAVKREAWEECGIRISVKDAVFTGERFFYYGPEDAAWRIHLTFFLCDPESFELTVHDLTDESYEPQWIPISTLTVSDFQDWGEEIVRILARLSAA